MKTSRRRQRVGDIGERARFYRNICGLPCRADANSGRIVLQAGDIGAVTLPMSLGEQVHGRLTAAGAAGPVIGHDTDRWTLLTRPHGYGGDIVLAAELNAFNVQLVPPGATVLLPSTLDDPSGRIRWVAPPRDDFRPAMDAVLDTLDYVLDVRRDRMRLAYHSHL
ncbi:hypothetical protein [Nocardia terpenica]|uniref:Uncharacterized protein n=1 Tax=Nocardia terpenica TaxID=455432 RepID=A0A6G9ZC13_9NOCA|nr:hypothetical protein [Nocardia terpenica]QIS22897.1 hypothetical protein F6W96_35720 [Nocardia terpenica]